MLALQLGKGELVLLDTNRISQSNDWFFHISSGIGKGKPQLSLIGTDFPFGTLQSLSYNLRQSAKSAVQSFPLSVFPLILQPDVFRFQTSTRRGAFAD